MKTNIKLSEIIKNFPSTLLSHKEAVDFIREHKLWQGMGQYGWFSKVLVLFGLFLAFYTFTLVGGMFGGVSTNNMSMFSAMGQSLSLLTDQGSAFIHSNLFKYLVFILMEVVIFHFARRSLEIKTGKDFDTSFKAFWSAEKRMIKVAFRCIYIEFAIIILIKVFVNLTGFSFLLTPLSIIVQCYFLGFLMIDNYNEIFRLSIKESARLTQSYAGVALAIGLVSYMILLIPVLGSFLAPLLGAVAATLAMHRFIPAGPVGEKTNAPIEEDPTAGAALG